MSRREPPTLTSSPSMPRGHGLCSGTGGWSPTTPLRATCARPGPSGRQRLGACVTAGSGAPACHAGAGQCAEGASDSFPCVPASVLGAGVSPGLTPVAAPSTGPGAPAHPSPCPGLAGTALVGCCDSILIWNAVTIYWSEEVEPLDWRSPHSISCLLLSPSGMPLPVAHHPLPAQSP